MPFLWELGWKRRRREGEAVEKVEVKMGQMTTVVYVGSNQLTSTLSIHDVLHTFANISNSDSFEKNGNISYSTLN